MIIRFDQNYIFYGACLVEKMFLDFTDDKIWPNFLFLPSFSTGFESDWIPFARDLWGIIQQYTSYGLWTGLRAITIATLSLRVCYPGTQLGQGTPVHRLAARTERESIRQSITLPDIAYLWWPLQRQLAALHRQNKFVSSCGWIGWDDQNVFFCWLDYDRRKQLMLLESESFLLDQRPALVSSPRGAAFRLIAENGVEHSSYGGVQIRVALFWFSCRFPHEK